MRMSARLSMASLLVAGLAACGASDGHQERAAGPDAGVQPAAAQLLTLADQAASRNGGEAVLVQAARSTRGSAELLSGSTTNQPDVPVWVVQVSGSDYVCELCSGPSGGAAPKGRFLTMVYEADDFESTSFHMSPTAYDLASLGPVQVLRDNR